MDLHIQNVADKMGAKRSAGEVNVPKCEKEVHPNNPALPLMNVKHYSRPRCLNQKCY